MSGTLLSYIILTRADTEEGCVSRKGATSIASVQHSHWWGAASTRRDLGCRWGDGLQGTEAGDLGQLPSVDGAPGTVFSWPSATRCSNFQKWKNRGYVVIFNTPLMRYYQPRFADNVPENRKFGMWKSQRNENCPPVCWHQNPYFTLCSILLVQKSNCSFLRIVTFQLNILSAPVHGLHTGGLKSWSSMKILTVVIMAAHASWAHAVC